MISLKINSYLKRVYVMLTYRHVLTCAIVGIFHEV